jgi:hypothetical protein
MTVVSAERASPRMASVNPAPRGPLTYTPSGLPWSAIAAYWLRRLRAFYSQRPWPFCVFALEPVRRSTSPWPLILRCAATTASGTTILVRPLRSARRGREAREMGRVGAG